MTTLICAHRGGGDDAFPEREHLPGKIRRAGWENRMNIFQSALDKGHRSLELDVWLNAEGVPVILHDGSLERTHPATAGKHVRDMTTAELEALDPPVPTLKSLLDLAAQPEYRKNGVPPKIFIELKSDRYTPYTPAAEVEAVPCTDAMRELGTTVADLVRQEVENGQWRYADLPVIGFTHEQLTTAKTQNPDLHIGFSFSEESFGLKEGEAKPVSRDVAETMVKAAQDAGAISINPDFRFVGDALMTQAKGAKLDVNVWAVNSHRDIKNMMDAGVTTLITDYPDRARHIQKTVPSFSSPSSDPTHYHHR